MNYKHPHEWLVQYFIVKERPRSSVPRGKGCVLYAGAFAWQAALIKKVRFLGKPHQDWAQAVFCTTRCQFFLPLLKQIEAPMQGIGKVQLNFRVDSWLTVDSDTALPEISLRAWPRDGASPASASSVKQSHAGFD